MMIRWGTLIVAMILAAGDWLAVAGDRRRLELVFKPATMLALLVGVWAATRGADDGWQATFFLAGFALSLAGDVFLMLRGERLFLAGLVAFLLAHVSYVVGFNPTPPPRSSFVVLIPVAATGAVLFWRLARGLRQRAQQTMLLPVGVYSLAISLMLFSAWSTLFRPAWGPLRSWVAALGATLFFASDAMLAWDRFVSPFPMARLCVHVSYHLAQVALAASVLMAT